MDAKFASYRIRIEIVLSNSNVLSEVQRSLVDGGMHIKDLLVEPTSRAGAVSSHLGQPRPEAGSPGRTADGSTSIGGPAGLWHFVYRSIYLDQYVSSEFSSPINSLRQQKRLKEKQKKIAILVTTLHFAISFNNDFCRMILIQNFTLLMQII